MADAAGCQELCPDMIITAGSRAHSLYDEINILINKIWLRNGPGSVDSIRKIKMSERHKMFCVLVAEKHLSSQSEV